MISKHADKLPNMHSTTFRGLPLVIQWPRGSTRVGTRPDGTAFKTEMKADYGYIPQTEAAGDEERLDVYIGPNENAEFAYAIEQLNDAGELDEWKMMLGFDSLEDAEAIYLAHNDEGWEEDHVGDIEEIPLDYLFDMVEKNQEVIGKEAAQTDLFRRTVDYEVERPADDRLYVDAKLIGEHRWQDITVGNLYLMKSVSNGESVGLIYDGSVFQRSVEKHGIDPAEVYQGMYDALIGPAREMGIEVVHDHTDRLRYWKNLGCSVTFNSKELKAKIASEHTLIEAFVKNYEHEIDFYQEVASLVQDKLDTALADAGIKAVVSSRAKRPSRLAKKLQQREPKRQYKTFRDIYDDIVDLAGVRVALYMPADREALGEIIQKLLIEVRPAKHFPKDRGPGDSLGYVADHYLVTLRPESLRKKELRYADTQIEIQVASVLMHAWAEVTHDLLYKPEKGNLTRAEMGILKDLNDLVQTGERQLEKLQNAIEGRTDEDLRFDIVAALQEFRLQASKIAGTAPTVSPRAPRTERLIYLWPEGYTAPRIMQGGVSDHHLFMTKTKAYPTPLPNNRKMYDESYRGYATVAADQKRVTLQPSENSLPYLKTVPQKVVDAFQQKYPQYEITVGKSQWASYMRARLAFFRVQKKADDPDDRLKKLFEQQSLPQPVGPDDPFWYEALKQIGRGRKYDELTEDERQQVIALAQTIKQK